MQSPPEVDRTRKPILLRRSSQNALNRKVRQHGDVSRLVNEAVAAVDLETVKVVEREKVRGTTKADLVSRTIMFETHLLELVREIAAKRGVSVNVLVDGAVKAHFSRRSKPAVTSSVE